MLSLIAQGETNRGAAARLFISEATVKTHLLHIYAKLDVNDRAAAVATAFERGLLPISRDPDLLAGVLGMRGPRPGIAHRSRVSRSRPP